MIHVGSVGVPTDNGAQAGPTATFANPPISGIQAGDLIVVFACYRATSVTLAMGGTDGQTWSSGSNHQSTTATLTVRGFWCIFNGTWSTAPSVTVTSGTLAITAVMHVFRPAGPTWKWNTATMNAPASASAPGSPFTCAGQSVSAGSRGLTINAWASDDDNTWGSLTSANGFWSVLGSTQYRNTQGNDTSMVFAYLIFGSDFTPSINQATNGGDPFVRASFSIFEDRTQPRELHHNARLQRTKRW